MDSEGLYAAFSVTFRCCLLIGACALTAYRLLFISD